MRHKKSDETLIRSSCQKVSAAAPKYYSYLLHSWLVVALDLGIWVYWKWEFQLGHSNQYRATQHNILIGKLLWQSIYMTYDSPPEPLKGRWLLRLLLLKRKVWCPQKEEKEKKVFWKLIWPYREFNPGHLRKRQEYWTLCFFITLVFEILNLFQICQILLDYLKTLLPLFDHWINLNVQSETQVFNGL